MKAIRRFAPPLVLAVIFGGLALWLPATASRASLVVVAYLREMVFVIPPVFILMGLLEVWIPKEKVQQLLGRGSGLKGIGIAFVLGTLPTGPLYVAFPLAGSLLHKGARLANVVIFLSAWAAVKIPQLMVEAQFLGLAFTGLRSVLTFAAAVATGLIMEALVRSQPRPGSPPGTVLES